MDGIQVGSRVRVARRGRRVMHVPCLGEIGFVVGHYPDDPSGYVYAVRLEIPKSLGGMTVTYQADELDLEPSTEVAR